MTMFIFAGDLLVMLFMVLLVIWVFMVSSDSEIDSTAQIPLQDEVYEADTIAGKQVKQKQKEAGVPHG